MSSTQGLPVNHVMRLAKAVEDVQTFGMFSFCGRLRRSSARARVAMGPNENWGMARMRKSGIQATRVSLPVHLRRSGTDCVYNEQHSRIERPEVTEKPLKVIVGAGRGLAAVSCT